MKPNIFRLKDIEDKVDLSEVMKPRYKIMGVYARVKDGVLVIVGTAKLTYAEIQVVINHFISKLKTQKKKAPVKTNVFWYAA